MIFVLHYLLYLFTLRLVNILRKSQYDQKEMWQIVKKVRPSNQFSRSFKLKCNYLLEIDMIRMNNDLLESLLGMKGGSHPMEDVTKETLNTAGKMFTYMNLCYDIGHLYKDIFKDLPKNMIFALKDIRRKSVGSNKLIAEKIWSFVTLKLNLTTHYKLHYMMDDKFSLGRTMTENFRNVTWGLLTEG